jgi:amino acid transporter
MLGFIFGDYASQLFPLGENSPAIYAALATIVLTVLNVMGVQQGKWTQNILTAAKVLGLLLVFAVGLLKAVPSEPIPTPDKPSSGAFGLAMIFVLLTYGGWNEAAYISAELKDVRRNMLRALMLGIGAITVIYLLVNFAYLKGLGLATMAKSEVVAADLLRNAWGDLGAKFISVLIAISALGAMNATIFTGARTNYAWGQDFKALHLLGIWHERTSTPVNALVVQGLISLGLVALGAATRKGFSTMVDYTAPVFWFFFLLTGLSLFILRNTDAETQRPFHTLLYPLTPLLFCVFCVYMLQSSLSYTGVGALFGVAVLLAGIPVLMLVRRYE